ncbi:MAG: DNA repair protein RadC [Flavobacteriales bacterium]|nr:DNA repair protein RadC [Flavobacteriales bacterium]
MTDRTQEATQFIRLKDRKEDERPRERLLMNGPRSLSDSELLAILISSGTKGRSALDVARDLLQRAHNDLAALGRLGVRDLMTTKGLGEARAVTIAAALELGRRRREAGAGRQRDLVATSLDAFENLAGTLEDLTVEEFWLLLLDRGNRLLARVRISEGGFHGTVADPKRIFKEALDHKASSLILAHNHPSGQLRPSEEDIRLTRKLVEAGRFLDIVVQDHLIVAAGGYFSFADQGMLGST